MEAQKRYQNKHEIRIENRSQNGRLGEAKPSVSLYTFFKIDVWEGLRKSTKNGRQMIRKSYQNGIKNHPDAGFLIFWGVLGGDAYSTFLGTGKSRPKIRKNQLADLIKKNPGYSWGGPAECAGLPGR